MSIFPLPMHPAEFRASLSYFHWPMPYFLVMTFDIESGLPGVKSRHVNLLEQVVFCNRFSKSLDYTWSYNLGRHISVTTDLATFKSFLHPSNSFMIQSTALNSNFPAKRTESTRIFQTPKVATKFYLGLGYGCLSEH